MKDEEGSALIAFICFMCIAMFIFGIIVYSIGVSVGRQDAHMVYPTIETGSIPIRTPVWAVYMSEGRLVAVSAIQYEEALFEFNVKGGPVAYLPLDPPDAWFPMSASWSRFNTN